MLTLDPTDKKNNTIYLGTGEANRCSSGCEAGVGIYKSTDGGNNWKKLDATCVSNATYACASPGEDAFLGRGIRAIVIDPNDKNHIFVGSALAVRGLSHVIGNGGTNRIEPAPTSPASTSRTDGGATFTEVWDGAKPDVIPIPGDGSFQGSFGITDVGLDPLNSERRLRGRRSTRACGAATPERRRRPSTRSSPRSSTRGSASTG